MIFAKFLLAAAACLSLASARLPPLPDLSASGLTLLMEDDFTGANLSPPDPAVWTVANGYGE